MNVLAIRMFTNFFILAIIRNRPARFKLIVLCQSHHLSGYYEEEQGVLCEVFQVDMAIAQMLHLSREGCLIVTPRFSSAPAWEEPPASRRSLVDCPVK